MNLRRTVAPTAPLVTLVEAQAHLRADAGGAEQTLIGAYIQAVTDHLDGWSGILGRALVTQTWELALDAFPDSDAIAIPLGPLQSVAAVEYITPAGATATMPAQDYIVDTRSPEPRLVLASGASWPSTVERINAVIVRFVAGYGAPSAVPAAIKAAALLLIGDLYENREAQGTKSFAANVTVDRLLTPYRILTA